LISILRVGARPLEWSCQVPDRHSFREERASRNNSVRIFQRELVIGGEIAQIRNEILIVWKRIIVFVARIGAMAYLFEPGDLGGRWGGRRRGRIGVAIFFFATVMMMVAMMVGVATFQATKDLLESGQILRAGGCRGIICICISFENFISEFVNKELELILVKRDGGMADYASQPFPGLFHSSLASLRDRGRRRRRRGLR
jgi:hypothetical protein